LRGDLTSVLHVPWARSFVESTHTIKDFAVTSSRAERCVHLQAIFQKAGARPPLQLHLKGFKGDGFLKHRA
jgi:hypothetical protein